MRPVATCRCDRGRESCSGGRSGRAGRTRLAAAPAARSLLAAAAAGLLLLLGGGAALAHDGWIQPNTPIVALGEKAYLDLMFGNHSHGHASYRLAGKWDFGSTTVAVLTPGGERRDLTSATFDTGEGDEVSPKGVKGYLATAFVPDEVGLFQVFVLGDRLFKHADGTTTRTLRLAKTFVAATDLPVLARVHDLGGQERTVGPDRLELVPLFNPAAVLPGQRLAFRLLDRGLPAAGQRVTVIRRTTAEAVYADANAEGVVAFRAGPPDYYLVRAKVETDEGAPGRYDGTAYEATLTVVVQNGGKLAGAEETLAVAPAAGESGDGSRASGEGMHDATHQHAGGGGTLSGSAGARSGLAAGGRRKAGAGPLAGLMITVNGRRLGAAWEVLSGRVYVPADALAGALGGRAVFNPRKAEHGVTVQWRGRYLHLHTGERDAHVDGKEVSLDGVAAYVKRGTGGARAMIPLRFVVEALGGRVEFRPGAAGRPAAVTATLLP